MGWQDLAPHCGLSKGLDGKATAARGSGLPPWSLKEVLLVKVRLGGGGERFGSEKPASWGDLGMPIPGPGVEHGNSQSGLLASGFHKGSWGTSFLRTSRRASQNPFHEHHWNQALWDKALAELIRTTTQSLERGVWTGA